MTYSEFMQRALAIGKQVTRPVVRQGWWHWIRFGLLLMAGSYLGHVLSESQLFTDWRYAIYQKQVSLERRGPVYPKYTALVLLDDDDYWSEGYEARAPMKRDKLAALLDRLNDAGVNTVAFNVFLEAPHPSDPSYDFPSYRAEDKLFFEAIKRMCDAGHHVILATSYWYPSNSRMEEPPSIYTGLLPELPCIATGHTAMPDDLRKIPGQMRLTDGRYLDSLPLAITRISDPIAYHSLVKGQDRGYRFAQFLTPEDFSTRDGKQFIFSGTEIEHMAPKELRQALADRTVIVGAHWHDAAYGIGDYVNMFDSPGGIEPGPMLDANYVEAMRDPNSTFTPISDRTAEFLEWGLAFCLALLGALEIHAGWKWGGFIFSFLACIVLTYVLLQNLGLFLDFFIPIIIVVIHTLAEELLEMRREMRHMKHRLREIHK